MSFKINSKANRFEPKLAPGLVVLLRQWTDRARHQGEDAVADINIETAKLLDEAEPLQLRIDDQRGFQQSWETEHAGDPVDWDQYGGDPLSSEEVTLLSKLQNKMGIKNREVRDAWLQRGIVGVEELEIDETEGTVDDLLEHGNDELLDEIWEEVRNLAGLNRGEEKNSESPTTSED